MNNSAIRRNSIKKILRLHALHSWGFHYAQGHFDFDDIQHGSGGRTHGRESPLAARIPIGQPGRQGRNAVLHPTRQPQKIH